MSRTKTILLSILLALPVFLFVLQHYFIHSNDLQPTGFTNEENVLYMSYAEQYLDQDKFSLAYSNPFNADPASAKIYFQPATLLLAGLMKLGMDPGLCFSLFGLFMTICCIYVGIRILKHLLPDPSQLSLVSILFTWGGGLTALVGLTAAAFLPNQPNASWIDGIYLADPDRGWWGLNWGRTLFIPLEAFYHSLFLLNIYFILKKRWIAALFTALILSISHPFTGIEYLLIINGWLALEKLLYKNKEIPWWFWIGNIMLTVIHIWYYLIYLKSFPEHKLLLSQYSVGWSYSLWIAIPAYCIVGALSMMHIYFNRPFKKGLALSNQRLFLCWAIIAFLLSKHEWFIKPMQPIHFTRGYVWAGLFLFGIPALISLIRFLKAKRLTWLLYIFILVFLSDNILWTFNLVRGKNNTEWEGHITKDTKEVLNFLHTNAGQQDLLSGNAPLVNYLSNVYTHTNSWVSHPYNTPNRDTRIIQQQQFMETGIKPIEWNNRRILLLIDKRKGSLNISPALLGAKLFENASYMLLTP